MLVVRFRGGLGNQMYQYAFCLKLRRLFPGVIVKTDLQEYNAIKHHYGYEVNHIFPVIEPIENIRGMEYKRLIGEIPMLNAGPFTKLEEAIRIKLNKLFCSVNQEIILKEENFDLDRLKECYGDVFLQKDFYLDGFWASINQYIKELDYLRRNFVFREFTNDKNVDLSKEIKEIESVSVHIRRGDYLQSDFDILSLEYYKYAIEYICNKTDNPVFYFFSDDPEFIKNNFSFVENKRVIDWNKKQNSFRDMQLMSMCKHNIIANSTFSQWGALLNSNPEAIIIYPSMKDKVNRMEKVQLKNWHQVELEDIL